MIFRLLFFSMALQTIAVAQESTITFSFQKNQNCLDIENWSTDYLSFDAWLADPRLTDGWLVFNKLPSSGDVRTAESLNENRRNKPDCGDRTKRLGSWVKSPLPNATADTKEKLCYLPVGGTYKVSRQRIGDTDNKYWFVCKHESIPEIFLCFRSLAAYFTVCRPGRTDPAVKQDDATDANTIKFMYEFPDDLVLYKQVNNTRVETEFIVQQKDGSGASYYLYFNATKNFADLEKAFGPREPLSFKDLEESKFKTLLSMSYRLSATRAEGKTIVSAIFTPSWLHESGSEKFHGNHLPPNSSTWGNAGKDDDITLELQNQYQAIVFEIATNTIKGDYKPTAKQMKVIGRPQVGWPILTGTSPVEEGEQWVPETINLNLPEGGDAALKSNLIFTWNKQLEAYRTQPLSMAQLPMGLLTQDKIAVLAKRLPKADDQESKPKIESSQGDKTLPFDYARIEAIANSIRDAYRDSGLRNQNEWLYLNLLAKYLEKCPEDVKSKIGEYRQLMLIALEHYAIRRSFQWASYFHAHKERPEPTPQPFMNDDWKFMNNKTIAGDAWNLINPPEKPPIMDRLEFQRYAKEFRSDEGQVDSPADDPVAFVTRDLANAIVKYLGGADMNGSEPNKRITLGVTKGALTLPTRKEFSVFEPDSNKPKATPNLWLQSEGAPDALTDYLTDRDSSVTASSSVLTPESSIVLILRPDGFKFEQNEGPERAVTQVDSKTLMRILNVMYEDETTKDYSEVTKDVIPKLNEFGSAHFWETQFLRAAVFAGHENFWLPFAERTKKMEELFPVTTANPIVPGKTDAWKDKL